MTTLEPPREPCKFHAIGDTRLWIILFICLFFLCGRDDPMPKIDKIQKQLDRIEAMVTDTTTEVWK